MANEKLDLIDRKALIAEYDRVHIGPPGGARKLMEDAPSVEAVEVVRCKDCKGWCTEEIAKRYGVDRYCTMTMFPTDADDFCSYGERREGE